MHFLDAVQVHFPHFNINVRDYNWRKVQRKVEKLHLVHTRRKIKISLHLQSKIVHLGKDRNTD